MKTLALVAAALLMPSLAIAQQTTDPKWSAWLGCWDLVLENSHEADETLAPWARRGRQAQPRDASGPQVCVQTAPGGATFSTRVGT